ncbi:MAG TPA: hypothetical protein VGJ31_16560, partial [Dongiaceae bacterium]
FRPIDIASLRNDIGNGVKGILHDLPMLVFKGRQNRGEFRHIPRKSQSLRNWLDSACFWAWRTIGSA